MSVDRSIETEQVIARLVDELEPVRRIPSMRRQVLRVGGVWAATGVLVVASMGMHPDAVLGRGRAFASVAAALLLTGFAGITMGLAGRVPGRERFTLAAAGGVALGLGIVATIAFALPVFSHADGFLSQCIDCAGRSVFLAMPSALVAMALALRGVGWRHELTGLGLATGATSLGALLVHLNCPSESPSHWLVAHTLFPALGGIATGLLAAWVLRRIASRSSRTGIRRVAG